MPSTERREWTPMAEAFGGRASRRRFFYDAFIPDELADADLRLPQDVAAVVAEAERAVAELNVRGPQLTALEVLSRQLLRAEAVASSRIEGLELSHRRIARADFDAKEADATAREVLGNLRAMEKAVAIATRRRPFTVSDLLDIHKTLFADVADQKRYAGKIRDRQNWIGKDGSTPYKADYIPPVPERVRPLLEDLVHVINRRDDMSPVTQAAVVHAQFETIHPFGDGNGRVGRSLIHFVLRRRELAPTYVPPISLVLATDQKAYVGGLVAFRSYDDDSIARWIALFAQATREAARQSVKLANGLAKLEADWRTRAGVVRRRSTPDRLIEMLAATPVVDIPQAAKQLNVEYETARLTVERLVKVGVLTPTSAKKRDRIFEAREVFDLIDSFERDIATPPRAPRPSRPAPAKRQPTGARRVPRRA